MLLLLLSWHIIFVINTVVFSRRYEQLCVSVRDKLWPNENRRSLLGMDSLDIATYVDCRLRQAILYANWTLNHYTSSTEKLGVCKSRI